jgi:hypothetical protein
MIKNLFMLCSFVTFPRYSKADRSEIDATEATTGSNQEIPKPFFGSNRLILINAILDSLELKLRITDEFHLKNKLGNVRCGS